MPLYDIAFLFYYPKPSYGEVLIAALGVRLAELALPKVFLRPVTVRVNSSVVMSRGVWSTMQYSCHGLFLRRDVQLTDPVRPELQPDACQQR